MASEQEVLLEAVKSLQDGEMLSFYRSDHGEIVVRVDGIVDLGRRDRRHYRQEQAISRDAIQLATWPIVSTSVLTLLEKVRLALKYSKDYRDFTTQRGGDGRGQDGL